MSPESGGGSNSAGLIAGAVIGAAVATGLGILGFRFWRRKKKNKTQAVTFDEQRMEMFLNPMKQVEESGYDDFIDFADGSAILASQEFSEGGTHKAKEKRSDPSDIKCKTIFDKNGNKLFVTKLEFLGQKSRTDITKLMGDVVLESEYAEISESPMIEAIRKKLRHDELGQDLICRISEDEKVFEVFQSNGKYVTSFNIERDSVIATEKEYYLTSIPQKLELTQDLCFDKSSGVLTIDSGSEAGTFEVINSLKVFEGMQESRGKSIYILTSCDDSENDKTYKLEAQKVSGKSDYEIIATSLDLNESGTKDQFVAEIDGNSISWRKLAPKRRVQEAWTEKTDWPDFYETGENPFPVINGKKLEPKFAILDQGEKFYAVSFQDLAGAVVDGYTEAHIDYSSALLAKVVDQKLEIYGLTFNKITSCEIENDGSATLLKTNIKAIEDDFLKNNTQGEYDLPDSDKNNALINLYDESIAAVRIGKKFTICRIDFMDEKTGETHFSDLMTPLFFKANLNLETKSLTDIEELKSQKVIMVDGKPLKVGNNPLKCLGDKRGTYFILYSDLEGHEAETSADDAESKRILRNAQLQCQITKVNGKNNLKLFSLKEHICDIEINEDGEINISAEDLRNIDSRIISIINRSGGKVSYPVVTARREAAPDYYAVTGAGAPKRGDPRLVNFFGPSDYEAVPDVTVGQYEQPVPYAAAAARRPTLQAPEAPAQYQKLEIGGTRVNPPYNFDVIAKIQVVGGRILPLVRYAKSEMTLAGGFYSCVADTSAPRSQYLLADITGNSLRFIDPVTLDTVEELTTATDIENGNITITPTVITQKKVGNAGPALFLGIDEGKVEFFTSLSRTKKIKIDGRDLPIYELKPDEKGKEGESVSHAPIYAQSSKVTQGLELQNAFYSSVVADKKPSEYITFDENGSPLKANLRPAGSKIVLGQVETSNSQILELSDLVTGKAVHKYEIDKSGNVTNYSSELGRHPTYQQPVKVNTGSTGSAGVYTEPSGAGEAGEPYYTRPVAASAAYAPPAAGQALRVENSNLYGTGATEFQYQKDADGLIDLSPLSQPNPQIVQQIKKLKQDAPEAFLESIVDEVLTDVFVQNEFTLNDAFDGWCKYYENAVKTDEVFMENVYGTEDIEEAIYGATMDLLSAAQKIDQKLSQKAVEFEQTYQGTYGTTYSSKPHSSRVKGQEELNMLARNLQRALAKRSDEAAAASGTEEDQDRGLTDFAQDLLNAISKLKKPLKKGKETAPKAPLSALAMRRAAIEGEQEWPSSEEEDLPPTPVTRRGAGVRVESPSLAGELV